MSDASDDLKTDPKAPRKFAVVIWGLVLYAILLAAVSWAAIESRSGAASSSDVQQSTNRRDCVTVLSTARRSVFDNVDIYKAIQVEQLSTALLNAQSGVKASDADIEAFRENDLKLREALVEARRLQPSSTLDDLIEHGGVVAGRHYDACPG